jgi:Zn-dependent M28 family amino/carboxypeptidase
VHEITPAVATTLLGEDVLKLAAQIESSGKPVRRERKDVRVSLRAGTSRRPVPIDNIVGLVRGSDAALAAEYVVIGAHYDHIGVDTWGRIGCGADDNGSGSSSLLEQAEAMALAKPRRSILFCWFSSEEDGLDGSKAFCDSPPVPTSAQVSMLCVDMVGRLAEDEVYVIGAHINRAYEDVLKEAKKLKPTQIKKVFTDKGLDLWTRSDHYNFQEKGVPAMFFTEGAIDADNEDYHRWTDTVDKLSLTKMARISRFMFNTAWVIANAPKRPPAPQ